MLIVLEGIDGSGKTTAAHNLATELRTRGHTVVETREPGKSEAGLRLRALLAQVERTSTPEEELQLFHADRTEHVRRVVRPALERGDWVVQDRTYFSTAAYQGALGLDVPRILEQSRAIAPEPDLTLFLKISPEAALERIAKSRESFSSFERLDYLREVDRIFSELAATEASFRVVDAMLPPEQLAQEILALISPT